MMAMEVTAIGLATAQGAASDICSDRAALPPAPLPWPFSRPYACSICRPAPTVEQDITGVERWRALAMSALAECRLPKQESLPPLILASCNGGGASLDSEPWSQAFDSAQLLEGTPWQGRAQPVVSGSCCSGLQALFLAKAMLENGIGEVVVLAVDILSPANHDNFESLRILSPCVTRPWRTDSEGFIPGEAAVALRLRSGGGAGTRILGPVLGQDLGDGVGTSRALRSLGLSHPDLVIGLGSGPSETDAVELRAIRAQISGSAPISTALPHFGHTNGVSGLLSLALAVLATRERRGLGLLHMPDGHTSDGRPLAGPGPVQRVAVVCRALGGACAAVGVGSDLISPRPARQTAWLPPAEPSAARGAPLMIPVLRDIENEAPRNRPREAPDLLLVHMEAPLLPPRRAVIGGRLLPSCVLEITPGFTAQLLARVWGFAGPAICLVGNQDHSFWKAMVGLAGRQVHRVHILGKGRKRHVQWKP